QTPVTTIRTIRLQRATQLLASKQYNIAEITYMVGYSDLKSFRNQFRKKYGVNPKDYSPESNSTLEESS
ncbi:MAG: helix-turn-helix domain-containing protein, partial [Bacteroidota bacterium]